MRLTDLQGDFIARTANGYKYVENIEEADGLTLLCPICFERNGGSRGTHWVICWSPKVGQDVKPVPGRWELHGSSLDDLTLVAGSSSVQLDGSCRAHFYVRNGAIEMCA